MVGGLGGWSILNTIHIHGNAEVADYTDDKSGDIGSPVGLAVIISSWPAQRATAGISA